MRRKHFRRGPWKHRAVIICCQLTSTESHYLLVLSTLLSFCFLLSLSFLLNLLLSSRRIVDGRGVWGRMGRSVPADGTQSLSLPRSGMFRVVLCVRGERAGSGCAGPEAFDASDLKRGTDAGKARGLIWDDQCCWFGAWGLGGLGSRCFRGGKHSGLISLRRFGGQVGTEKRLGCARPRPARTYIPVGCRF